MIPHRQEYPLRKRICPLLADRRQAERALLPSRSSKPCTRTVGVQRADFGNNVSRPGQVAASCSLHRLQQAARTWHREMADHGMHDRGARAALAQAKKFLLSAPRCCGLVTSRSQLRFVAVVGENDSLTFFFQAVTDRCAPAFGAFFYWFSVWRRRRRSAWSWRSTVGGSFFFLSSPLELPAIRLEGILLLTPSLVGLLLQYTRNPRQTGRKRKRSSTHRRSPATNKVVEILILGTYLLLDHSFDYLRASPSNSQDTPLWSYDFAFLEKALKKWRKLPPYRNKRPKTKKINEHSWSPFDCVTLRVTQQHSRRYFQLDLTMSCRESMLQRQFPATRGTHTAVPAICNHWTWRQNQSARNLNHFCRAPFRISGHFRWPITPLFFGIFLSFFSQHAQFPLLNKYAWKKLESFVLQNSHMENLNLYLNFGSGLTDVAACSKLSGCLSRCRNFLRTEPAKLPFTENCTLPKKKWITVVWFKFFLDQNAPNTVNPEYFACILFSYISYVAASVRK